MPHTSDYDLNPILEAARVQSAQAAEFAKTTNSETTRATEEIKRASEQRIAAEQVIATQANVAELQSQNNTIKFFENAGGLDIFNRLGEAYKGAAEDVLAAEAEIEKVMEDNPADGILSYISQQIKLTVPEDNLKSALGRSEAIRKVTSDLSQQTESVARAVNFTKKAKNLDTMKAEQSKLSAIALEEHAKTSIEAARLNADGMGRVLSATSQELSIAIKQYELQNSEETLQRQRESHAVSMELANHQLNKLELDEKTTELYIPLVQAAQAKAGFPVEDPLIIRDGLGEVKKGTATGLKYQRYIEIGLRQGNYGYSPSEAAETVSILAPTGTEMTPPLQILEAIKVKEGEKSSVAGYEPPKNKVEAELRFNSTGKELSKSWRKNVKQGDTSNPFQAPPFAAIAESNSVKSSAFYTNILAPLGLKEFSANKLFTEAARGISTKLITPEEATLGIETIMKASVAYNNNYWQFDKVGMPLQDSYFTYAEPSATYSPGLVIPTIFSATDTTSAVRNILDPVEIKHLIIKYLAKQSRTGAISYGDK